MMHKLTYKAQLSQNRQLTGAATPCLPTIPAEGKLQTSLFVEYYLHVRQPTMMYNELLVCITHDVTEAVF
jgi:hypothetical protein